MMPAPFTLLVLPVVVVAKELMFRFVNRVGADIQSGAVKTDAWHHRSDAITSALAFVGIAIALWGGPGWESADDWAALLASGVIVCECVPAAEAGRAGTGRYVSYRRNCIETSKQSLPPLRVSSKSRSATCAKWASTSMSIFT